MRLMGIFRMCSAVNSDSCTNNTAPRSREAFENALRASLEPDRCCRQRWTLSQTDLLVLETASISPPQLHRCYRCGGFNVQYSARKLLSYPIPGHQLGSEHGGRFPRQSFSTITCSSLSKCCSNLPIASSVTIHFPCRQKCIPTTLSTGVACVKWAGY